MGRTFDAGNFTKEISFGKISGSFIKPIKDDFISFDSISEELDADVDDPMEIFEFAKEIRTRSDNDWSPPKPSSDAHVWRYLNFTQLLSILERGQIWFTKVNRFDDPYEGSIPKPNLISEVDEISEEFGLSRENAKKIYQIVIATHDPAVESAYVNCWNVNDNQSAALWEQYVNSPQGVAIRTTVKNLNDSLEDEDHTFNFGNVEYINYDENRIPEGDLPAVYHKRESFEHESEYRVSYVSPEEDLGKGFYADIDPDLLIDQIVISPIAPDWFSELVDLVLSRYDVDCDLKESGLYTDPDVSVQ